MEGEVVGGWTGRWAGGWMGGRASGRTDGVPPSFPPWGDSCRYPLQVGPSQALEKEVETVSRQKKMESWTHWPRPSPLGAK